MKRGVNNTANSKEGTKKKKKQTWRRLKRIATENLLAEKFFNMFVRHEALILSLES